MCPRSREYPNTRFSNVVIEYLPENEKFRETVLAWSCGSQVESFEQKIEVENLVTLSLKCHQVLTYHDEDGKVDLANVVVVRLRHPVPDDPGVP